MRSFSERVRLMSRDERVPGIHRHLSNNIRPASARDCVTVWHNCRAPRSCDLHASPALPVRPLRGAMGEAAFEMVVNLDCGRKIPDGRNIVFNKRLQKSEIGECRSRDFAIDAIGPHRYLNDSFRKRIGCLRYTRRPRLLIQVEESANFFCRRYGLVGDDRVEYESAHRELCNSCPT